MAGFSSPKKSYGGGAGRYVVMKVVNRQDPEQAGRLQVRVIGYQDDQALIPDEDLIWARPLFPANNPMDGGIGGPVTGATEGTYLVGYYTDGNQQLHFTNTLGKSGVDNGSGQLDQSGRNSDTNPHSRDPDHNGGDFRYDEKAEQFDQKSLPEYARIESENAYGQTTSKDAEPDEAVSWSLGQTPYMM